MEDTLSVQDRYDLKAYQFNQYFPVPEKKKTVEEELQEERERLGLGKSDGAGKRKNSLQAIDY